MIAHVGAYSDILYKLEDSVHMQNLSLNNKYWTQATVHMG